MDKKIKIYNLANDNIVNEINELDNFIKNNNIGKQVGICDLWLLDTNKNKYSLLEQYIYEIAMFQFNKLNIEFDNNKHFIEFWWRCDININNFHIDCDENEKLITKKYKMPLLSNVLYFNETKYPTILTDVDLETYKYKTFENKNNITLSFPKKGKLISFNSSHFHAVTNIFETNNDDNLNRSTLMINLWDIKPRGLQFYNTENLNYLKEIKLINIVELNIPKKINVSTKIDELFMEDLLYNKNNKLLLPFGDTLIKLYNNNYDINESTFIFCNDFKNNFEIDLSNDYKIIHSCIFKSIYNKIICDWIIHEATNYDPNFKKIDFVNIKNIFNFLLFSFNDIIFNFCNNNSLNDSNKRINIKDLFIFKNMNLCEINYNNTVCSIVILLNSINQHHISILNEYYCQGDAILYDGKIKNDFIQNSSEDIYIVCNLDFI
jgi:hypothetical protein